MAIINLAAQVWKLCTIFYYGRPGTFYVHLCAITFAVTAFFNSQGAQQAHDTNGFIFWHNCWHVYPFLCIIIEGFDYFYLGEYDHTAVDTTSQTRLTLSENSMVQELGSNIHKVLKRVKSALYLKDASATFDEADVHKEKKRV